MLIARDQSTKTRRNRVLKTVLFYFLQAFFLFFYLLQQSEAYIRVINILFEIEELLNHLLHNTYTLKHTSASCSHNNDITPDVTLPQHIINLWR